MSSAETRKGIRTRMRLIWVEMTRSRGRGRRERTEEGEEEETVKGVGVLVGGREWSESMAEEREKPMGDGAESEFPASAP